MSELREKLNLPIIGGEIIAWHDPSYIVAFHWRIEFLFPGPNARYNVGLAKLHSEEVEMLILALEEASEKMKTLKDIDFKGEFSKSMGRMYTPQVEVKAHEGKVWLDFWVSSGTFRFCKKLYYDDLLIVIEKLRTVGDKAQKMLQTLEALV